MASSVVDAALSVAKSAAAAEVALQLGVEGDLEFIKYEFELMQTYLTATDEERSQDAVARVWARQVRDVAYDVEDYIEDFAIHLGGSSWWWCSPSKILNRRRIAAEMKKLRARVDNASKRRTLYVPMALQATPDPAPGPDGFTTVPSQDVAGAALDQAGRMGDIKRVPGVSLTDLLARQDSSLMIASIYVRPATTTTTLTGKAYDELEMTGQFSCRAWVTIQHPFNLTEFIRSMVRQFHANSTGEDEQFVQGTTMVDVQESIETMGAQQLIRSLARNLGHKSYLLVLEDISTREEWDSVKMYLRPDVKNGSRVIVTSQREDVAKYCAGGLRSRSSCLSDGTAVLPTFFNMDPASDDPTEASSSTSKPGNISSTNSEIEEPRNNPWASVIAGMTRDQLSTTTARVEEAPRLVGREKEMNWLISKIRDVDTENSNDVISICGMSGIGKTALVQNAYRRHHEIASYFRSSAWVTVSSYMSKKELLRKLFRCLPLPTFPYSRMSPREMRTELSKFCDKHKRFRCLLVIDGLSASEEWDLVKSFLTLEDPKAVFRVIVVTKELQVANYCSKNGFVYNLSRLHEDDAARLFRLKALGSENAELAPDMAKQANQILDKCGGIPFAILQVAQHLASRPSTATEWQNCYDHLNLDQLEVNPHLGPMRTALESSYSSLPYHLKYCFLYLSIFQEDLNIMRRRLLKRWIAEGYIRGIRGSQAEEVGEWVFDEFLSKTIIQPTKYEAITSGRVSSCSVHSLMLEVSRSKAMEEKLVCMLEDNGNGMMTSADIIRHLVVRRSWNRDRQEYKSMNLTHVRSLTVFGEWQGFLLSPDMRMLRVLDLEGVEGLTDRDLKHIGKFRHLKYLGLRSTHIEKLPVSVGKLQFLETLDIRFTNIRKLPITIVHLTRLRFLRAGHSSGSQQPGVNVPKEIGELRILNTLGTISVGMQDRLVAQGLRSLRQLQRLSVTGLTDQIGPDLCSTLHHLSRLQSLSLTICSHHRSALSSSLQADSLLSSLERLHILKLRGYLPSLPSWVSGLKNLFKLYLHDTSLDRQSDIMNTLARLPNLTTLLLLMDSIRDAEMKFSRDGFRELRLLELKNLVCLYTFSSSAGALPKVKTLQVSDCSNLERIAIEARAVPNLESLQITNCGGLRSLSFEGAGIKMPMLKSFHVSYCGNLQSLQFRAGDMPNLETLTISSVGNDSLAVEFEAGAMAKLKMLHIRCCRIPQSLSSSIDAGAVPNLETLRIAACKGLQRLSFGCGSMQKLETLEILYCNDIEELLFEEGATPKLETLRIIRCLQLTESAVLGLQHANPRSIIFE